MYGIILSNKNDTRKLLLDYTKIEHPLLKDFPQEGLNDIYYNVLDNQVGFSNHETIEL
jgi:NADH:ubiquinone oxidoreductase subunit C